MVQVFGKMNILIVDDKPENLLTLESLLDAPDYNLIRAESGNEALAKMFDFNIALVLMDVQMPGMDGYETAELMRCSSKTKQIPIIFVTAKSLEKQHIFKGYDAGAVDYLTKPIEPVILNSKIKIFLELFRQKMELEEKTRDLNAKIVELEELQQQLEEKNQILKEISHSDALTGIYNRRYFDDIIEKEWYRNMRDQTTLSVFMMDIDYFKNYNDTYGHAAGDSTLKDVAEAISKTIKRRSDTFARYGGEEFVAVLPDTNCDGVMELAERARQAVENLKIPHKGSPLGTISISIGIAYMVPEKDKSHSELIREADKSLYQAKSKGRNKVYCNCMQEN